MDKGRGHNLQGRGRNIPGGRRTNVSRSAMRGGPAGQAGGAGTDPQAQKRELLRRLAQKSKGSAKKTKQE